MKILRTLQLTARIILAATLLIISLSAPLFSSHANAAILADGWSDNFDSYVTGSSLQGQGGWKGWANSPAGAAFTSDEHAFSTPNSADIAPAADTVHEYSGYTAGEWVYTAWQYIPSDFAGESYFILLNQYDDAGNTLTGQSKSVLVAVQTRW